MGAPLRGASVGGGRRGPRPPLVRLCFYRVPLLNLRQIGQAGLIRSLWSDTKKKQANIEYLFLSISLGSLELNYAIYGVFPFKVNFTISKDKNILVLVSSDFPKQNLRQIGQREFLSYARKSKQINTHLKIYSILAEEPGVARGNFFLI